MKLFDRSPHVLSDKALQKRVWSDIECAFGKITTRDGKFIVNDKKWSWINPKGKIQPSVVNAAQFLSKGFQDGLVQRGWAKEFVAKEQRIDAHLEINHKAELYRLPESRLLTLLQELENLNKVSSGPIATRIFQGYSRRNAHSLEAFPSSLHSLFDKAVVPHKIRIGLEFETGNIASSFRALRKLDFLYIEDVIDIGVFATSQSKKGSAARIWPVSNRNGSFEELEKRNYKADLVVPLIEVGFEPDGFDQSAPYLGASGATYTISAADRKILVDGVEHEVFLADGREVIAL